MKYEDLKGKNAIVTGAAQGIGKATAAVFAQQGVNLALCDINQDRLLATAKEVAGYGVKVLPLVADVSNGMDVARVVKACEEQLGNIDILLNCAGISLEYKMVDLPEDIWDKIIDVNLKSVFLFCKAVANHMIARDIRGRIVTVSSQAAKTGEVGFGAYGASKAGTNTMTQAFALELAEYGITINAVCPGFIDTEMLEVEFREQGAREGMTGEEFKARLCAAQIPLGRMGEPREVGEFMAFLASESAGYITGVSLTIAGGAMLI